MKNFITIIALILLPYLMSENAGAQDDFKMKRFISGDTPPQVSLEHFVLDDVDVKGELEGSYKKNRYLTTNDIVYLKLKNPAVSVGDRFSIFTTGKKLGKTAQSIRLKGFVTVTKVLPTSVVGKIDDAKVDIHLGDKVGPELSPNVSISPQEPTANVRGKILGSTESLAMIGAYHFVYIDKGANDGIRLNDSLDVIRTADGSSKVTPGLPEVTIAKLAVVQLASHTAIAYAIAAADAFEQGATFKSNVSEVKYLSDQLQKSAQPQ